jgi:hypothetical protein
MTLAIFKRALVLLLDAKREEIVELEAEQVRLDAELDALRNRPPPCLRTASGALVK